MKKSHARIASAWERRNCDQVGPVCRRPGSMPLALRISQTVDAATLIPRPASSPWILRYPQSGFSRASRQTSARMFRRVAGRPGFALHGPGGPAAADDVAVPAQDRVRGDQQPKPLAARFRYYAEQGQSRARSAQFRFGRHGCRRCRTASWWRKIKISAVFQVSSRRDSRNQEAVRVVRRKTNRRHMTGDNHGRTSEKATLLVRAVDEILGTHRSCPASPRAVSVRSPASARSSGAA